MKLPHGRSTQRCSKERSCTKVSVGVGEGGGVPHLSNKYKHTSTPVRACYMLDALVRLSSPRYHFLIPGSVFHGYTCTFDILVTVSAYCHTAR